MKINDIYYEQHQVCLLYGAQCLEVSDDLIVGVSEGVRKGILPIHGLRYMYKDSMAGWFLWTGEWKDDVNFFQPLHVRHLHETAPALVKYLGLAPGWRFLWTPKKDEVWFDTSLLRQDSLSQSER
ncbi:MAG: hypothetical protein Q8P11_02690 [bacterium]|nr:hypothetical protein [bacterium]